MTGRGAGTGGGQLGGSRIDLLLQAVYLAGQTGRLLLESRKDTGVGQGTRFVHIHDVGGGISVSQFLGVRGATGGDLELQDVRAERAYRDVALERRRANRRGDGRSCCRQDRECS